MVEPAFPSVVEPAFPSVVEPASAASGVETQLRRVDLARLLRGGVRRRRGLRRDRPAAAEHAAPDPARTPGRVRRRPGRGSRHRLRGRHRLAGQRPARADPGRHGPARTRPCGTSPPASPVAATSARRWPTSRRSTTSTPPPSRSANTSESRSNHRLPPRPLRPRPARRAGEDGRQRDPMRAASRGLAVPAGRGGRSRRGKPPLVEEVALRPSRDQGTQTPQRSFNRRTNF